MTYSDQLKSPKWQKKRLLILQRDKFSCQICCDTEEGFDLIKLKYKGKPVIITLSNGVLTVYKEDKVLDIYDKSLKKLVLFVINHWLKNQ